ncbi:MAG: glycogen/starch/alpha-glucan phosphorylase, partial [Candidatus Gastranaerophilales bacterium]|nr:glycogen/starch/alpha-glucan phosphorylase [Candidatus Gastranaerophilales bacterium]
MTLPKIAYFSMEMAIDQSFKIYSGGLGFLAGTHMQSAGSLNLPMVGVTMLWSYGYYDQEIGEDGKVKISYSQKQYDFLSDPNITVDVQIFGQNAKVKVLKLNPETFGTAPVYLLTTDIPENSEEIRKISHKLYDGNE